MSRTISLARPGMQPAGATMGGKPLPVVDVRFLMVFVVKNDARFNANADGGYRGGRVMAALEHAKRSVTLEHPEWEAVRDSLLDPRPIDRVTFYPVSPLHLILPFIEDVREAPEAVEKAAGGKRR